MKVKISDEKPQATTEELNKVQKRIDHHFPAQYKEFLMQCNGGRPTPSWFNIKWGDQDWTEGSEMDEIHFFLSIHNGEASSFIDYYDTFEGRIPNDTIAIAHDPGGNLVLLGTGESNQGKVFFWIQAYEVDEGEEANYSNVGFVADSFNAFIDSLFENE